MSVDRRDALKGLAVAGVAAVARTSVGAPGSSVLTVERLSNPWSTPDPFLFCVHHDDRYPAGNEKLGPVSSLEGRELGMDFAGKDGWRMYHGKVVPGFPMHPHRGFETVTVVRKGFLDHSDSMGATARYGGGDVQWLTTGRGISHAEMFPLLESTTDNPVELFQIWLNLPRVNKMADPHFSMLWNERIPKRTFTDAKGRTTEVTVVAGKLEKLVALKPPPKSWAADASAEVAIWTLKLAPNASFTLPASAAGLNRRLYFFRGESLTISEVTVGVGNSIDVISDRSTRLTNGVKATEVLVLQGRPIGEPVAKYGPFVMNTRAELEQAFADYQRTQFGKWPWASSDPVHSREQTRFAKHADGRIDKPSKS